VNAFRESLSSLIDLAESVADRIVVKKGSRGTDFTKLNAASSAHQLLTKFGQKPPTLTTDGPYYRLASSLYESATGKPCMDLSRQCRKVSGLENRRGAGTGATDAPQ